MHKTLLIPSRRRRVPTQFSWVDQRLVRERHVRRCGPHALGLYLFLITVADAQGLSYYSDGAIAERLGWSAAQVRAARAEPTWSAYRRAAGTSMSRFTGCVSTAARRS